MVTGEAGRRLLGSQEGQFVEMGGLGARFMIRSEQTNGAFAVVEHPLAPGVLATPMHTHTNEDEYSYVLEGEIGVQVGEETITARQGDLVFKPRGVPHSFWNASDAQARVLELISPAGFEAYFAELAEQLAGGGPPDMAVVAGLWAKYGLEMDFPSVFSLSARHGVHMAGVTDVAAEGAGS